MNKDQTETAIPFLPFPPSVTSTGAFVHAMTYEDRKIAIDLTLAINRLAIAIESYSRIKGTSNETNA